jgi:hypothetical protein
MATKKKILNDGLTNKQRIMQMVERWPDDIPFEQALYHMYAMKEIMEGIKSAEEEECVDHDRLFDELERLCDEEENQNSVVAKGAQEAKGTRQAHRGRRRPEGGEDIHKSAKKVGKRAS